MKILLVSLVALPVAGFAFLKATKQTITFDNGMPKLTKISALKVQNAAKEGLKAAATVATATGGAKVALVKEILNQASNHAK